MAGAKILELFGDAATKLCLREAGVEGLFRAYESVDFLAPVYTGDTLRVTATITRVGHTSRRMRFVAVRTKPKKIVCRAVGTVVIPERRQPPFRPISLGKQGSRGLMCGKSHWL